MGAPVPLSDLPDNLVPADDLPDNLRSQPSAQEQTMARDVLSTPTPEYRAPVIRQAGQGMFEGVAGTPGLPIDALFGVGNFARRQFGLPETPLATSPLRNWGSEGWARAASDATGATDNGAPQTEAQRLARKAGTFVGASAPFGVRALALAPEAFVGSEVGRAADQAAPGITHGYGEFAGGIIGPSIRPAAGAAVGGVRSVARTVGNASPETLAPGLDSLRAQANAGYDALRNSDVIVKPQAVNRLAQDVRGYLANQGYSPKLQPGIGAVLDELDSSIANGNVTYQHLINLRRIAQNAGKGNVAGGQGHLAGQIVDRIDSFLERLPDNPQDIVSGSPAEALQTLRQANSAYTRVRKVEALNDAIQRGLDNAGPHVGNVEGMISTQLKGLLRNQKTARQFTPVEREAIRRIVHGDNLQNVLRYVGKFSPENIIPALAEGLAATGWAFTNPLAAAGAIGVAGTGFVARRAAGARTNMAINRLSEQLRRGPGGTPETPPPNFEPPAPGGFGGGQPPVPQLPAPSSPAMTMYSNPLDPAAFKQLFLRQRQEPSSSISQPLRSDVLDRASEAASQDQALVDARRFNSTVAGEALPSQKPQQPFSRTLAAYDPAARSGPVPTKAPVSLGDNAADQVSWIPRGADGKPSRLYFPITQNGQEVGYVMGRIKGDTFYVNLIKSNGGPQSLSPTMVRQLGRSLRQKLPGIKSISGDRITGARRGPAMDRNRSSKPDSGMTSVPAQALAIPFGLGMTALASGFNDQQQ